MKIDVSSFNGEEEAVNADGSGGNTLKLIFNI